MKTEITENIIKNIKQMLKLKSVKRAGWVYENVPLDEVESVSDHTFGVALLVMLIVDLIEEKIDLAKALQMAILHDLAETVVGDITPRDNISKAEKFVKEDAAMQSLTQKLNNQDKLLRIWHEYEEKDCPEARLVKDCDHLELLFQTDYYYNNGKIPFAVYKEFREAAIDGIKSNNIKELALKI